jgi:rhamnosyltransferase
MPHLEAHKIACIFTAYNPNRPTLCFFKYLNRFGYNIYVIDNTPNKSLQFSNKRLNYHSVGYNAGLGFALNKGLQLARGDKCNCFFLFDQDSRPTKSFFKKTLVFYENYKKVFGKKTIISPNHLEIGDKKNSLCRINGEFRQVSALPTSGIFFEDSTIIKREKFSEDIFLDLVDFDWCFKLKKQGYRFFRIKHNPLLHKIGRGQKKLLGFKYNTPEPFRHYYTFRDTIRLCCRSYTPFVERLKLIGLLPIRFVVYPLIMDDKVKRFKFILYGVFDFFQGIKGIGYPKNIIG